MTVKRAVAAMAIATIASRLLGFLRVIVIAAVLGTTALGNTFQSTNSISNVLFDLLAAGALSAALVPQLVRTMHRNHDDLKKMVSSLVTLVIIVLGSVSIIGILMAGPIAQWLFARAPETTRASQIHTGTILLRFFMPQILLYGFGAIAIAVLTAKKKFVATVLAPIGSSLFIIFMVVLFAFVRESDGIALPLRDTLILGIAGTGACIAFVAIPVIVSFRNGVPLIPSLNLKSGLNVLSSSIWAVAIQASAAIILGAALFIGNQRTGAVVAYQLAFVFFLAPYAIISQSFSTVLLPDLSQNAMSKNDTSNFSKIVSNMMTWTYRPMLVATGVCLALYAPVTNIVAEGGAKSGQGMVEVVFVFLVLGIVPYSLFQATSRIFFARSNIRLPAITVLLVSIIVSLCAIVGSKYVSGSALLVIMGLAHTMTYVIAGGILLVLLHRQGYKVFPDKITYFVFIGSIIYAGIGFLIGQVIVVKGRLNALAYCSAYVLVTLVLVYVLMGSVNRRKVKTMLKQIMENDDTTIASVKS